MSCQGYKGPEQTFSCAYMWVLSRSVTSDSLWHHGLWHNPPPHPISSVHGISQAKIVEWDAFSSSRVSSLSGIELASPILQADSLTLSLQGSHEETQGLLRGAEHSLRILNPRQVPVQSVKDQLRNRVVCVHTEAAAEDAGSWKWPLDKSVVVRGSLGLLAIKGLRFLCIQSKNPTKPNSYVP